MRHFHFMILLWLALVGDHVRKLYCTISIILSYTHCSVEFKYIFHLYRLPMHEWVRKIMVCFIPPWVIKNSCMGWGSRKWHNQLRDYNRRKFCVRDLWVLQILRILRTEWGVMTMDAQITFVSEARVFDKHALGNQGKSSGHCGNWLLDKFRRVYIF